MEQEKWERNCPECNKKILYKTKKTFETGCTNGLACNVCARSTTQNEFIEKAQQKHNYKYDYSLTVFRGYHNKIKVICPFHGVFEVNPFSYIH